MTSKLFIQAITKYLLGVVLVGVLIFLPVGTLDFAQGWILMGILFIPMFIAGVIMLCKSPDLLRSRLDAKEKQRIWCILRKSCKRRNRLQRLDLSIQLQSPNEHSLYEFGACRLHGVECVF